MKEIVFLAVLSLLSCHSSCRRNPHFKEEGRLTEEKNASQGALELTILFFDEGNPLKKGFWIFSSDRLEVVYRLINRSDSILYIEPPHVAPLGGNPSFAIEGKGKLDGLRPKDLTGIEFFPTRCLELKPGGRHENTLDLLSLNQYDFVAGQMYKITAIYSSGQKKLKDSNGTMRTTWTGTVKSNVIEFEYPK